MRVNRITLFANIDERDGKRIVLYPAKMTDLILSLRRDRVKITIQPDARPKSHKQLGYYRAVVLPHILYGLKEAGNGWLDSNCKEHMEYVHELMLERFAPNKSEVMLPDGSVIAGRGSTATMDTLEMTNYIESIRMMALDMFNLDIPDPDENWNIG